ncbi:MAG: hypothetical protein ABII16_00570 [Patescibacteria group bacterium]
MVIKMGIPKIKQLAFRPEVLFFLCIAILEAVYVYILFGDAELLASGDNYTYLQLGKRAFNLYIWDTAIPLGGINNATPNLLGFPLYSTLFSFLSTAVLQRLLIFCLYFFGFVGFYKLTRLFSRKFSVFALLPATVLFSFNAFGSLNPFSFFPLMYGAYLPLSLYYFIKLVESKSFSFSYIFKLLVLSVIFTPINSNPALSVTIFIPQALYLVLSIKNMHRARVLNVLSYYIAFILVNLWWVTPMLYYYMENANRVFKSGWFSASSVGHLYQNFRFIGQWGWYGKHFLYDYYPFHDWYDKPTIFFFSYALVIFTIALSFGQKVSSRKPQIFFIALFLLSLFLVGGSRSPFGFVYTLLFNYFPGFKIFREPFTKFGELYVLSFSVLFYVALTNIEKRFQGKWKFGLFMFVLLLVLMNAKPVLLGEHVWSKWNGSVRTSRINIPTYWKEFEKFTHDNLKDARILTTPKSYYGGAWNWIYGFSSADDIAVNFVDGGNSVLRNPIASGSEAGEVIDNIFRVADLPKNYLALLSVDYILQENDLDWRYSGELTLPPSQNDLAINKLGVEKIQEFGEFDPKYLLKIPNGEANTSLREELYAELTGRPALVLYKVPEDNKLPKFYIPKDLVYSWSTIQELPYVLSTSNYAKGIGVFIKDTEKVDESPLRESADRVIFGTRKFSRFSLENLTWKEGWAWPVVVNTNPTDFKYKFVQVKEDIEKAIPKNPLDKADLLLWLAAKRAAEIAKYRVPPQLEEQLVRDYANLVDQSMEVLKNVPKEKIMNDDESEGDFWGMVGKVLMYVERSNATIPLSEYTFGNSKDPRVLYKNFVAWIYEVSTPDCGDYCYTFKVPEDGRYSVYVGDSVLAKLILPKVKIADLEYTEVKNQKDEIKGWYYDGITTFQKGKNYIVNLSLPKGKNLIGSGGWLVPNFATLDSSSADFVMQNIFPGYYVLGSDIARPREIESSLVLWDDMIHYKPLENFESGKKYSVSFEYSTDSGGLGIAIIESNSPVQTPISNSQLLLTKVLVKAELDQSCLDRSGESNCWRSYKKIFRASNDAKSALFYIYAYPYARKASHVRVKNISVEEVLEPIIVVKKGGNKSLDTTPTVPNIVFSKINSTKYKVSVSGVTDPYDLIFSESYNRGWRMYLDGTKLISNSSHDIVNGYANLWHVSPEDADNKESYTLVIEFYPQRIFRICVILSLSTFLVATIYFITARMFKFITAIRVHSLS